MSLLFYGCTVGGCVLVLGAGWLYAGVRTMRKKEQQQHSVEIETQDDGGYQVVE
ncbi:MAG: hypothetical protein JO316_26255 [Abitibacteriaceae bacterium]|nr:hypothetical protein [Abditibacteriaceae bacterium]